MKEMIIRNIYFYLLYLNALFFFGGGGGVQIRTSFFLRSGVSVFILYKDPQSYKKCLGWDKSRKISRFANLLLQSCKKAEFEEKKTDYFEGLATTCMDFLGTQKLFL